MGSSLLITSRGSSLLLIRCIHHTYLQVLELTAHSPRNHSITAVRGPAAPTKNRNNVGKSLTALSHDTHSSVTYGWSTLSYVVTSLHNTAHLVCAYRRQNPPPRCNAGEAPPGSSKILQPEYTQTRRTAPWTTARKAFFLRRNPAERATVAKPGHRPRKRRPPGRRSAAIYHDKDHDKDHDKGGGGTEGEKPYLKHKIYLYTPYM